MTGGITYCSTFRENEIFGAVLDYFPYCYAGSYIIDPEYEPKVMLKSVFFVLASSEST